MAKFSVKKFRDNLTILMDKARITLTELHKNTGVPITTLQRLKNDPEANPTITSLKPIADFFNLSIDTLISADLEGENQFYSGYKENHSHWTKVPILSWKQAVNWKQHIKNTTLATTSTDIVISDNAYALKMEENLEEGFRKNSTIIIDPDLKAENMDYIVVYKKTSRLPAVKQLYEHDGTFYLKPLILRLPSTPLTDDYIILGIVRQIKLDLS